MGDPGRTPPERNPSTVTPALGKFRLFRLSRGQTVARVGLGDCGTCCPPGTPSLAVLPPKDVSGSLTAVPTAKLLDWLSDRVAPGGQRPEPRQARKADEWSG